MFEDKVPIALFIGKPFSMFGYDSSTSSASTCRSNIDLHISMRYIGRLVLFHQRSLNLLELPIVADDPRIDHDTVLRCCQRAATYDAARTVLI